MKLPDFNDHLSSGKRKGGWMDGIRCARGIKSANYSITLVVVVGRIGARLPPPPAKLLFVNDGSQRLVSKESNLE